MNLKNDHAQLYASRRKTNRKSIRIRILFLSILALYSCIPCFGQAESGLFGQTPAGIAPGNPAGSYGLSDIESVNLYGGRVNATIPLIGIGGRGSAGLNLVTRVGQSAWTTEFAPADTTINFAGYLNVYDADKELVRLLRPEPLGAGILMARSVFQGPRAYSSDPMDPPDAWTCVAVSVVFSMPDGTEHFLYDELTGGTSSCWDQNSQKKPSNKGDSELRIIFRRSDLKYL